MTSVRMFCYGTLMHYPDGSPMRDWVANGETAPHVSGTTKGILLDAGPFPYADFDGDGTITGQILTMDDESIVYRQVCQMEMGAGYTSREVIVHTSTGSVVCIGWQIDRSSRFVDPNMPVVPSGDWFIHIGISETVK